MTETAKIVQTTETDKALLAELQANTVPSQLLRQELTEDQVCDYTSVPEVLQQQALKAAFSHLQKFGTPSKYANRFWQNFWVNNDAVSLNRTLVTLGPDTHTESNLLSRTRLVNFSSIVDRGEVITGATLRPDNATIDINEEGVWMATWAGAFSFFPAGYGNQAFDTFTTNPNLNSKVRVGCGLVIVDGTTTRYGAYAETEMTGKHLKTNTLKLCSGSAIMKLSAGNSLQLLMNRSGGIGNYMNGTTPVRENIGFRKIQNTLTGGIPNRDACNFLTLVRLS